MTPGEGVVPVCPSCGASVAVGVKFCGECGASLPAAPAGESRRQVTVLFSDVAGSTELGERIDPEALRALMGRFFASAAEAIERHGGTVEKYIGDAVMAVFGLPELHEDDAMRAVRAAVDVREAVARLGAELEARHGLGLKVRIGVNTGEVVAGEASLRQQLVTGDAVNVAARLEQAAQPSEILLGPVTWHLVRDAVEAEAVGPLELKGKSERVNAYRLLAIRAGAEPHARRFGMPMVGRDADLAILRGALDAAVAERAPRLVTLVGAAGIGKSRLTHEFVSSVRDHATVLRGRCLPYGEGITYWPIALAVRSVAGINDTDDPTQALAKVTAFVEGLPESSRIAAALAGAIGLGSASAPREEIGWAVRRLLEGKASAQPVVLVVDDIQWGEETLLDLLESIVVLSHGAAILLLCIARPDLLDARPGWGSGVPGAVTLRLEPLAGEAVAELIANLGDRAAFPPAVGELLASTAEGNPLFLEELMAMLVEDGVLQREDGAWRMAEQPVAVQVPPTIQALLAARLDRLDPGDRAVAQRAAVIGRVFQRGAVIELSQDADRARVDGRLVSLVRKELIRRDASGDTDDAFRFRHLLVRDAAYEGLPKQERAELHRRFAEWLLRAVGDRLAEFQEIVGHHFEQAFRYRRQLGLDDDISARIGDAAAGHLAAAAFRALDRSDLPAAAGLLRRALAVMRLEDPRRIELVAELIDALMQMGRIVEATAELDAMRQTPGIDADPRQRAWLDVTQLLVAYQTSNYQISAARLAFEAAIRAFERAGDVNGLGRAWLSQAHASWWQLQAADTIEALDRALAYARQAGRRSHELSILSWLTKAYAWGPTPVDRALSELDSIMDAARGDRRIEAAVRRSRAGLLSCVGRTTEAAAELDAAVATFAELGMTIDVGEAEQTAYVMALVTGRLDEARRRIEEANRQLEAIGEEAFLSTNLALLAALLFDSGLTDEAEQVARRATSVSAADDLSTQWHSTVVLAEVEAWRGNSDEARQMVDTLLATVRASDFHVSAGDVLTRAAEVYRAAGHHDRARELFEQALDGFRQKGATAYVTKLERRMASLDGASGLPERC